MKPPVKSPAAEDEKEWQDDVKDAFLSEADVADSSQTARALAGQNELVDTPLKFLVVEDEKEWQDDVKDALLSLDSDAEVAVADNSQTAVSLVDQHAYDVAVLDVSLSTQANQPNSDAEGIGLLNRIRQSPQNQNCVIVINTAHNIDLVMQDVQKVLGERNYLVQVLDKDDFTEEVLGEIVKAERAKRQRVCVLSFTVDARLSFRFDGAYNAPEDGDSLRLSRQRYNRQIAFFGRTIYRYHDLWLKTHPEGRERILREHQYEEDRKSWREQAEIVGQDFYQLLFDHALFEKKKELHQHWGAARNAVNGKEQNLVLRFNGPAENLALPFELLDDEKGPLVLRHPMARQINQTLATNSKPSWWEFLNSRRKENSPIRVLLMAADKDAVLEIEKVAQQLEAFAQRVNVRLLIDPLDGSHLLTMYEVRKALENSQHHLIHYVGHATFNEDYPESSYLGTPQDEKDGERITAGELHDLLQESPTQFLYLSCCSGAEMGKPTRGNQHWGLLHAAINAGVAASLGFRWWVRMESARRFAEAFYQSLDDSPLSLEHAAFRARKAIHRGVIHVVSDDALKQ